MKKAFYGIVLSGAACAISLATSAANAADLPSVAPPPAPAPVYAPPPPVFTWTGFYIGANAGVSIGSNSPSLVPGSGYASGYPSISLGSSGSNTGFTGGGQVGYNWQAGAFVFGVESDINYLSGKNLNGTYTPSSPYGTMYTLSGSSNSGYLGTVRGRVGIAFNRALFYATGGLAYDGGFGGGTLTDGNGNVFSSTSKSGIGYALGGGVEYALTQNWSIKAEYLRTTINNNDTVYTDPAGDTFSSKFSNTNNIVRLGVNYKF